MANTYQLIASNTISTATNVVTFSSIPATYTDLVLRYSIRNVLASNWGSANLTFNAITTGSLYSAITLWGIGTTAATALDSNINSMNLYNINAASTTANTFTSGELYIPSYTVAQNKPMSNIAASENNSATVNYNTTYAQLIRTTAAINSFTINLGTNYTTGSSFYLYGIKNS